MREVLAGSSTQVILEEAGAAAVGRALACNTGMGNLLTREPARAYEPHWLWAVTFVGAPLVLIVTGFLGMPIGSSVPLRVAESSPLLAVMLTAIGMGAAVIRRRKVLIQLAGIGLAISVTGYLLLLWL